MGDNKKTKKEADIQLYGLGLPEDIVYDLLPEDKEKTPDLVERRVKQRHLLNLYLNSGGQIRKACEETGISYNNYKSWQKRDKVFALACEEARKEIVELLESEIIRRGFEGIEVPLHYQGIPTGHSIRQFSDNLIMFKMKQLDPSYRDGNQTNIGIMGKNFKLRIVDPKADIVDIG